MEKIRTEEVYVGWTAVRDDWDLDDPIGFGKTEAEAIEDLLDIESMERK